MNLSLEELEIIEAWGKQCIAAQPLPGEETLLRRLQEWLSGSRLLKASATIHKLAADVTLRIGDKCWQSNKPKGKDRQGDLLNPNRYITGTVELTARDRVYVAWDYSDNMPVAGYTCWIRRDLVNKGAPPNVD